MTSALIFRVEMGKVTDEWRSEAPFVRVHVIPLIDGDPCISKYKD